jgi:peptidoglycan/xylan/chitin deacetylase (PgdA/CDA1 family)
MAFTALMYHSLSDGRYPDTHSPKYTMRLKVFREHLAQLIDSGFNLCSFADLEKALTSKAPLPDKTCALTFDDGHRSSLDIAEAAMERGITASFFITVDYCRNLPDFLSEEEIRALARLGFDFGTHGMTHRPLNSLSPNEMKWELSESKSWLEDVLERRVRAMSLPAGQGSRMVQAEAFRQGYRLVATSRERRNEALQLPSAVDRMVVLSHHTARDVVEIASATPTYVWRRRLRGAAIWLPKKLLRAAHRTRATLPA